LILLGAGAQAATLTVPTDGDVILGFIATSGTGSASNLEVDLGSISQFTSALPGSTLTLTHLSPTDIQQIYGDGTTNNAAWNTRLDLTFGAIATTGRSATGGTDAIWATLPELTPGTVWPHPYTFLTTGQNALGISDIEPVANFMNSQQSTANSDFSLQADATLNGSWTKQDHFLDDNIHSFRIFSPVVDNAVGNVVPATPTSLAYAVSDFYEISPTVHSLDIGKFELFSDGTLKFVATPVPEPSSIGLMGVGFLSLIGMVVLRRRRSVLA
jgi:hypothetical protein